MYGNGPKYRKKTNNNFDLAWTALLRDFTVVCAVSGQKWQCIHFRTQNESTIISLSKELKFYYSYYELHQAWHQEETYKSEFKFVMSITLKETKPPQQKS